MVVSRQSQRNIALPMTFAIKNIRGQLEDTFTLLVNPNSKTESYGKMKNEHRVRADWKIEHWGDDLRRISMTGTTMGFYSQYGLTRFDARNSESFENFMKLIKLYKNNGINFVDDNYSGQRIISTVGRVVIFYDTQIFEGSFDDLTVTEDANSPFILKFSFNFVVTSYSLNLENTISEF